MKGLTKKQMGLIDLKKDLDNLEKKYSFLRLDNYRKWAKDPGDIRHEFFNFIAIVCFEQIRIGVLSDLNDPISKEADRLLSLCQKLRRYK